MKRLLDLIAFGHWSTPTGFASLSHLPLKGEGSRGGARC